MLIKATDPGSLRARVIDESGKVVPYIASYNTITLEADIYQTHTVDGEIKLLLDDNGKPFTNKIILPYSRISYLQPLTVK